MSIFDGLFDNLPDDENECDEITCKFCGEAGLIWSHDGRRWYLTDEDCNEHKCDDSSRVARLADDFDDIE